VGINNGYVFFKRCGVTGNLELRFQTKKTGCFKKLEIKFCLKVASSNNCESIKKMGKKPDNRSRKYLYKKKNNNESHFILKHNKRLVVKRL
jgi:hypothetical protein